MATLAFLTALLLAWGQANTGIDAYGDTLPSGGARPVGNASIPP
ncbi:MAG: hypothetical protein QM703_20855 [Gemmatales bacterium]